MVPLDFQGKPFYWFGPRIQMINHPQTMKVAGSLVQFVGTPEVFMKTLGEFFVHAETREKNSKTSKNCCLGVNCRVFFSTKLLGDIEKHSIISIVAICCLRLFFQKVNISTKRTMDFFSFIFGLVHCCFHTLLKRWSFCFVNRTTFFSRVFRGFISETIFFTEKKNPWVMGCVRKLMHKILHK